MRSAAAYGRFGTITATPGRRDDLVTHVLRAADVLSANPDCRVYLVATTKAPDDVATTEVWSTQAAHDAPLADLAVHEHIAEVRPLVAGMGQGALPEVRGGIGLP